MSASPLKRLLARRRFAQYVRRTGWVFFWGGAAWTLASNTMSHKLVIAPLVTGIIVVALTEAATRLLRNYRHKLRREGELPSSSRSSRRSRSHKTSAAAPKVSQATLADYGGGATGYEKPAVMSRLSSSRLAKGGALRRTMKVLVYAAIALPVVALIALWMCFQGEPLVAQGAELSMDSYEKAQKLIESHDPRSAAAGGLRTIVASQEEVNLVVNYAAKRYHDTSMRVALRPGAAIVQASMPAPWSPFGPWLNVDAVLRETDGVPTVDKLKVGSLPVPAFIADFALGRAMARFNASEQGRIARDMVKSVTLSDAQVRVVYEWREDLVTRARATLVPQEDQERFRAYTDRLVAVVDANSRGQSVALSQLLPSMFALAKQRSGSGDAAKENRAAIITLAFFAFGRDLSTIIPAASSWRAPVPLTVTLYGRDDTAQHFLVSAALAVEGGSPLSNAIGVYREVDDSKRTGAGKGFSFQDLVADRAGTRFGTLAAKSPQKLQAALSSYIKEGDFMPPFSDLQEEIPEAEFKKRYGGVGSPTYNSILADIEARVARTPLLR